MPEGTKKTASKPKVKKAPVNPNTAALRRLAALQREGITAEDRSAVTRVIRLLS